MTVKDARVDIKTTKATQIRLTHKESERFSAALQNAPKANEKLKQLFNKHSIKQ